jgi:hypothetical protein
MSAGMYGASQTGSAGQPIFTDDVSLQVFMEHLKRLVCPWVLPLADSANSYPIRPLALRPTSWWFFCVIWAFHSVSLDVCVFRP